LPYSIIKAKKYGFDLEYLSRKTIPWTRIIFFFIYELLRGIIIKITPKKMRRKVASLRKDFKYTLTK
jgi:hypothetical protein